MKTSALGWLGILLAVVLVVGCYGGATPYLGKHVAAEHVVALAPGQATGTWETFDVAVRYAYTLDGGRLNLTGSVTVADHYQMTYEQLKRFELELVLLDSDARVLKTYDLDVGLPLGILWQMDFERQFALPDGVTAFSFAYDGAARGAGEDSGDGANFWLTPR